MTESPHKDRGHDVSYALTEIRTVLSRAKTALDHIQNPETYYFGVERDPDHELMVGRLTLVIQTLSRWKRYGK